MHGEALYYYHLPAKTAHGPCPNVHTQSPKPIVGCANIRKTNIWQTQLTYPFRIC